MADSFQVSIEATAITAALSEAASSIVPEIAKQVGQSALAIKKTMQTDAERSRYFKIAPHIGYDQFTIDKTGLSAQIGPQRRGAGKLSHIAYFGGAHGGGATIRDPQKVADEQAPHFEKALLKIIDGIF